MLPDGVIIVDVCVVVMLWSLLLFDGLSVSAAANVTLLIPVRLSF